MTDTLHVASKNSSVGAHKIVSMKLFASWEIDKTSSSCIPRLCMFSATGLQIFPSLVDEDVRNVVLAVQMAGSKRVLRSGEIPLNPDTQETCLDISFSLQYAHFLKRDDNNLSVALQRKKKYKNRPFLGYKTLAGGTINLSQVLQRPKDLNLDLCSTLSKEKEKTVAVVTLQNITSKPISYDDGKTVMGFDRSPESDDDDDDLMGDELSADESCSDEETPNTSREQTNFKQKITKLLRRFKSSDDAEKRILTVLAREETAQGVTSSANLDDLFDELEDLSEESDNQHDNISVSSIRKPTLPVYFVGGETMSVDSLERRDVEPSLTSALLSNQSSLIESVPPMPQSDTFDQDDVFAYLEASQPLIDVIAPESVLDKVQLSKAFKDSQHSLPSVLYVVDERASTSYYAVAHAIYLSLYNTDSATALRVAADDEFSYMMKQMSSAIQSFCNNNSKAPAINLVLIGNDSFYSQALDEFTKTFSERSPDWLNYVRFILVPLAKSDVCGELSRVDPLHHQMFSVESGWQRLNEKALNSQFVTGERNELLERIYRYEGGASCLMQYPVSEAMIAFSSATNKDGSQEFIPFLTEVSIGTISSPTTVISGTSAAIAIPGSSDGEEPVLPTSPIYKETSLSSSYSEKAAFSASSHVQQTSSPPGSAGLDLCELQLEYWVPTKSGDKSKSSLSKETLKGYFKYIQVIREKSSFRLIAVTKEKRGKMIRLGKKSKDKLKEKESDSGKSQNINRDSITRIVCTAKDSSDQITVNIDEIEHVGVQFFQLSTHWQTHVKYLPVGVSKQYLSHD
ncbi:phosphofurin acidic cluster sorting protein 2-like [Watersipora subatra]|uniref:phosphofurin acidic cluster sorting protein 2-like n=1 Tax=Watersipora subatra TaxID=2589382 RepID=UPI00355B02A2